MEKGLKDGLQVRYLAEKFATRDPELSKEQVRSHYYQLRSQSSDEQEYDSKSWDPEDDEFLLNYIKENEDKKNKMLLFEELSSRLNRNPRAIASHYYLLLKKISKSQNEFDLDAFIHGMGKFDVTKLGDVVETLKEIQAFDDKDKKIFRLQSKLSTMEKQKQELEKRIQRDAEIIKSYERKFKNMQNATTQTT